MEYFAQKHTLHRYKCRVCLEYIYYKSAIETLPKTDSQSVVKSSTAFWIAGIFKASNKISGPIIAVIEAHCALSIFITFNPSTLIGILIHTLLSTFSKVNLLPFHQFGENKYKLLNKTYKMSDVNVLQKDDPQFLEFASIFKSKGLDVSF